MSVSILSSVLSVSSFGIVILLVVFVEFAIGVLFLCYVRIFNSKSGNLAFIISVKAGKNKVILSIYV